MTALTHKENDLHNRLIVAEFNLQQVEAELRRLHEVNAELVEACQLVIRAYNKLQPASSNQGKEPLEIFAIRAALAKATRREQ